MKNTRSSKYKKYDQKTHPLVRPDMYVGSIERTTAEEYVLDEKMNKIVKKDIELSPGLVRIFLEPLANAVDNIARSKMSKHKPTEIRVNIEKNGTTIIQNDGETIPIEKHPEEDCYNHTLIFGTMLTGSNYDDTEDRIDISGRNGVGVKCTVIFSKTFTVEGVDVDRKLSFSQTWKNNMTDVGDPIVKKSTLKKGYTKVTFLPDFERFGFTNYTEDLISLVKKYLIDIAMLTKINIYFNDEKIPVSSLKDYAKLYGKNNNEEDNELYIKTSDCEVLLTTSSEFQVFSFVNGIFTPGGGSHVDPWVEALLRPIVDKLNKKDKPSITIKDVKQFFRIFVVASLAQPKWKEQSKITLHSPKVEPEVKKTHIAAICRWPTMDYLRDIVTAKESIALKKTERKSRGYVKVEGLDSANYEGTNKSHECTLIIVEGLSAKTYAVQGIGKGVFGKEGRDWYGIYPIRGKLLNTRNSTPAVIAENKVIKGIRDALHLKHDVDYTNDEEYKKLRYGKLMILTDADVDGQHICGLILNFFHSLYPSLMKRNPAFIVYMQTPIVRVFTDSSRNYDTSILFYDENEYRNYVAEVKKNNPGKKIEKKYYKGLGTSKPIDVSESFGQKLVEFCTDDCTNDVMVKVFHKKHADARKTWLEHYDPNRNVLKWVGGDVEIKDVSVSDFLNFEMIKFSYDDCKRSIPSIMDGLKESHRKVMHIVFQRNLRREIKVNQLAGSVSEKTGYHHGEENLHGTIIGLAQSFVGSNNIPLLTRGGQFGTRNEGGKDAADARYIYTSMENITRLIFRKEDDPLLIQREDDGEKVEPYFFLPIIPMILVNGVECAIGTGWSSKIPCYNPIDVVNAVKVWLNNDGKVLIENEDGNTVSLLPELIPWYRGFLGTVDTTDDPNKFISWGCVRKENKDYVIEELPVGMSISKYKDILEDWREEKKIKSFSNHSGNVYPKFTITLPKDEEWNMNDLKLCSSISTTNMCLFTEEEKLRKFECVDEILDAFCKARYIYYFQRKKYMLDDLESKIRFMGNMKRFISEVIQGDLKLFMEKGGKKVHRKTLELEKELDERKYERKVERKDREVEKKEDDHDEEDDHEEEDEEVELKGNYNYLLRLQVRSFTEEKVNKLQKDIDSTILELERLRGVSEKQMWINDLDEFLTEYGKWLIVMDKEDKATDKQIKRKGKGKK